MRKQAKKHFFRIEANKISRLFSFISLRSKNDGSFRFFASFFHLVSFSFRFRFLRFALVRNKQKKHFFRIEAKNISLPFRFVLLRSKNDGAP